MPYISEYNTFFIDISGNLSNTIIDIIQTDISRNLTTNDLFNLYRYLTYEKIIENKSLYKHAYNINFDCIKHFFLIEEKNILKEYLSHYSSIPDEVIIICFTEDFTERPKFSGSEATLELSSWARSEPLPDLSDDLWSSTKLVVGRLNATRPKDNLSAKLTHPKRSEGFSEPRSRTPKASTWNSQSEFFGGIEKPRSMNDEKNKKIITIKYNNIIKEYTSINSLIEINIDEKTAYLISTILKQLFNFIEPSSRIRFSDSVVEPALFPSSAYTVKQTEIAKGIPNRSLLKSIDDESKFIPINNNNFIINNIDKTQNALGFNIYFVTVCDDINLTELLIESANINNIVINTVIIKNWVGFECKINGIIEFLKYIKNDNDIVCFVDAYDILFNNNVDNIINKFFEFSCNILFSSEIYCYPYSNMKKYEDNEDFNSSSSIFSYLNSGCFIGYKKNIIDMLLWKNKNEIKIICKDGGDQNYFTQYFLRFYKSHNIKLDFKQDIFQSMCGINYENIFFCKDGKIYNKLFSKIPSVLHFNGFGDMPIKKIKSTDNNELVPALKTFLNLIEKSKFDTQKVVKIPFIYPYEILVE
jgi:hypothetical protein